jgi:hypothetical protein
MVSEEDGDCDVLAGLPECPWKRAELAQNACARVEKNKAVKQAHPTGVRYAAVDV